MKFIKFTYVDAKTNICVTKEPAKNGPKFPDVNGLQFIFAAERKYPTNVPEFFGLCSDDAEMVEGCIGELTEAEFASERQAEIDARKPYPSWVANQDVHNNNLELIIAPWFPPVPYPTDGKKYSWNEPTTSWVEITQE